MSWWVMEQVSVNEAGTQTLANIQCDDVTDLPAPNQSATLGYVIVRGSQAKVLATSENYILGSTGTWVKMEDGVKLDLAGYATEQYVNDELAGKVDTSVYSSEQTAQDILISTVTIAEQQDKAALITQVDGGAKNMIDPSAFSSQTKNGVTLTKNPDDSFTITGTFTSRVTSFFVIDSIVGTAGTVLAFDGGEAGIYAYARNGNPAAWLTSSGGVPVNTGVPIPEQDVGESFDIAIMVNNSDGRFDNRVFDKTVRVMICTAADYAISPAFVPYVPTNRELYEMILALQ